MNYLLLRGLVREQRHWADFPELLKKELNPSSIAFLDFPGLGTQNGQVSPITIDGLIDDLRVRFLDLKAKATDKEWTVLAVSLGAMTALRWAERFPSDFSSLVVINTSAADLSRPWQRLKPTVIPQLLKLSQIRDPVQRELNILKMTTNMRIKLGDIARTWASIAIEPKALREVAFRQLVAAILFRSPAHIPIPILILVAKNDRFTSYSCSLELCKKYTAPLEIHPRAGHDLPLDDGAWVIDRIRLWAKSRSASF